MPDCPFIAIDPNLPESVVEFFDKNCPELVQKLESLGTKREELAVVRENFKNQVNSLQPEVKELFEEKVYKIINSSLNFPAVSAENVNENWAAAATAYTKFEDRPQDFPDFIEKAKDLDNLITELEEADFDGDGVPEGAIFYADDIATLREIKTTFQTLVAIRTPGFAHLEKLSELYKEHKKVAADAVGLASTGRDLSAAENLLSTGDSEAAKKRALRAEAAVKESRSPGSTFGAPDKAIYKEQCFLLTQIPTLLKLKNKMPARLPYNEEDGINKNAPLVVFDEPFGFMNRMLQAPHSHRLFNLTTSQISSLVPTLKLYKVLTDPSTGKDLGYVEIKFDSNPAIKSYSGNQSALDLFKSKNKRGLGVGLKDFNFTFHGSDPFAAKKAIQAKVSIFATSFGDLIQQRVGEVYPKGVNIKTGYKFADLALKTGKTPEDLRSNLSTIQKENLDKLNFRLKVVLGWAIPQKYLSSFTEADRDAVNDSFVNLSLTPTTHEFSFDEMGGVTFDINYLAYIEDYFNNSMFNIFSSPGIEANRIGRRLMYDFLENNNCEADDITKIREMDAQNIQLERVQSFRKIISDLTKENRILYYNLSYEQISEFIKTGKMPSGANLTPKTDGQVNTGEIDKQFNTVSKLLTNGSSLEGEDREQILESIKVSLYSTSSESNKISFIFASDLIDIIMKNIDKTLEQLCDESSTESTKIFNYANQLSGLAPEIKEKFADFSTIVFGNEPLLKEIEKLKKAKEQFKKLRIVLGPMEIKDYLDPNTSHPCTIGDVPISLNYFLDFLSEKKLSKDESVYSLSNFIKDLINDLLSNFLNTDSCFGFNTKQRIRLNSSTASCFTRARNTTKKDDISYIIKKYPSTHGRGNVLQLFKLGNEKIKIKEKVPPVLLVSGPSRKPVQVLQPSREFNYQIFYAGRAYPAEKMKGNEQEDLQNGIFHYVLGKDRGLVKNISLERTDMSGLKELRFEQEGFDGLTQLREVYNANIDSMLNLHTFPGTYIFVDPKGFSPEAGIDYTQFGIGGYYMITRSEHHIGPGKADTKITAKWVAHASKEQSTNENKKVISENESVPRKCLAQSRKSSFISRFSDNVIIDTPGKAVKAALNPAAFVMSAAIAAGSEGDS